MNKKYLSVLASSVVAFSLLAAPFAFAAPNPSGTGQPSQSCQAESVMPAGFNTSGFANAAAVYAGSPGTPSANNTQSSHAISQYDIACYQVTQKP